MATKQCPNGHQYDAGIYGANCPFCPSSGETHVNGTSGNFGGPTRPTQLNDSGTRPTEKVTDSDNGGAHTVIRNLNGTNVSNPDGGRKVVGVLVSYSTNRAGEVYKIYEGRNIIGRNHVSDICFNSDKQMSGQHLLIFYVEAEGIVWAEDQKSSNGTYINGQFARGMVELKTNDVICIGATKLLFLGIPKF